MAKGVVGPSSLAGGTGKGEHFRRGGKGHGRGPKGFHVGLKGSPGSSNPREPNGEIMKCYGCGSETHLIASCARGR
eukprot:7889330-Karenia_brevis.AAC.1